MTHIRSFNKGMNLGREKAVGGVRATSASGASGSLGSCDGLDSNTETYVAADSATMSLMSRSRSSAPFLTDNSESAPSYGQKAQSETGGNRKPVETSIYTLHNASNMWLKYLRISPLATLAMLYMASHA